MARRAPRVVEWVAVARGLIALKGHAVQRRAPDALGVGASTHTGEPAPPLRARAATVTASSSSSSLVCGDGVPIAFASASQLPSMQRTFDIARRAPLVDWPAPRAQGGIADARGRSTLTLIG